MRRYLSADGDVTVDDGDVTVDDGDVTVDDDNVTVDEGDVTVDEGDVTVDDDDVTVDVGDVHVTKHARARPRTPRPAPINLVLYLATCKLLLSHEGSFWRVLVAGGFQTERADLTETW